MAFWHRQARGGRRRQRSSPIRSRPRPSHFRGQGQERDLAVHVRRAEPRWTRSTTSPSLYEARRPDHSGQNQRPRRLEERGPRGRAEMEASSSTASRDNGCPTCFRTSAGCVDDIAFHQVDDRRLADPRFGHVADEHWQAFSERQPLRWARGSTTAWGASTKTCRASS